MNWTQTQPTEPGYYWFTTCKGAPVEAVEMRRHPVAQSLFYVVLCGDDERYSLTECVGYWSKIDPPSTEGLT